MWRNAVPELHHCPTEVPTALIACKTCRVDKNNCSGKRWRSMAGPGRTQAPQCSSPGAWQQTAGLSRLKDEFSCSLTAFPCRLGLVVLAELQELCWGALAHASPLPHLEQARLTGIYCSVVVSRALPGTQCHSKQQPGRD